MAKNPIFDEMKIDELLLNSEISTLMKETKYSVEEMRSILVDYENRYKKLKNLAQKYANNIKLFKGVQSISWRVKSTGSLCEKILRKTKEDDRCERITKDNYLIEIKDLVGIRALYVFPDEFFDVYKQIYDSYSKNFDGNPEVRYRNGDDLSVFKTQFADNRVVYREEDDYRSIHYLIHDQSQNVRVELQTRTIFEEGWSEINHLTVYGKDNKGRTVLRILSSILSRTVGTCNDISSLIYSIYKGENSEVIDEKAEKIKMDQGSFADSLLEYINGL